MVLFICCDGAGLRHHGRLRHCPTGTTLRYAVPLDRADALRARLAAMPASDAVRGYDNVRQAVRWVRPAPAARR